MKDQLSQEFGEYGYSVATTGKSLVLNMPRIEEFIAKNGDLSTRSSINNNTARPGTRQATRDERPPGSGTGCWQIIDMSNHYLDVLGTVKWLSSIVYRLNII